MRKTVSLPEVIQNPKTVRLYIEPKTKSVKSSKKMHKNNKTIQVRKPIMDDCFDDWQKNMAQKIFDGDHVILDVVTSCGKTWAARRIIAEVCLRMDWTAIFITPNRQILWENVRGLISENRKTYRRKGNTITGFQTSKEMYRRDDTSLNCQIMCLTADMAMDFLSQSANQDFLRRLKFIVCDEVHTDSVNTALWRFGLVPEDVQFILSSATIGNTDWLIQELETFRPGKPIHMVNWKIRPIPLQRAFFPNSLKLNTERARLQIEPYDRMKDIIFCANLQDPTVIDIHYLESIVDTDEEVDKVDVLQDKDRTQQFYYGQSLVEDMTPSHLETFRKNLEEQINQSFDMGKVDENLEAEPVLAMFQSLMSRDLAPALFFNSDSAYLVTLSKKLVAYLQKLENEDKEVRKQMKDIKKAEKNAKRRRDEEDRRKHINCADDVSKLELIEIPTDPVKWRFSQFNEKVPRKFPGAVKELLHYGIGIYIDSMDHWVKDIVFDWFLEKKLSFILCDQSLSMGVNLPARSIILTGDIDATLYHQMGGRAGRRGFDTEGYIFLATSREISQEVLLDKEEVRDIQPMQSLDMMEILRWSLKNGPYDNESIQVYLKKYAEISKLKGYAHEYMTRFKWLIEQEWLQSKFTYLVLNLEDLGSMLLIQLIRSDKLFRNMPHELEDRVLPVMILLAYLWEPVILEDDSDKGFLPDLPNALGQEVNQLGNLFGLDVPIGKKCDDYIIQFFKNGVHSTEFIPAIGRFQRRFFNLMTGFTEMTEKIDKGRDPIISLLKKIDEVMWTRCQIWRIDV